MKTTIEKLRLLACGNCGRERADNQRRTALLLLAAVTFMLCVGCEGPMPGRFSRLSGSYTAKPKDYNVEVLESAPTRPFEEIARLDVHIEHGFFSQPDLKDAMPELLKQARLSGADAIINIQERRSNLNESRVLHVTATGIRYKDNR